MEKRDNKALHRTVIPRHSIAAGELGRSATQRDIEMTALPNCPSCSSSLTYNDGIFLVCPECGNEWSAGESLPPDEDSTVHKDAVGNVLSDGDSVIITKDLKVKGASSALKAGTKVRSIRLVEGDHNIDCKIDGFGPMKLKSEFVKKAQA